MNRHSIIVRLNPTDEEHVESADPVVSSLRFIDGYNRLGYGIGRILSDLSLQKMYPSENAIDLLLLAAIVTAADTRISRKTESQDSWTREIDLYLPVLNLDLWSNVAGLIERTLSFLTGDIWKLFFRARPEGMNSLITRTAKLFDVPYDSVCLFSGGLDSFVGAIDFLESDKKTVFVSHYRDASTKSQEICAHQLGRAYGDLSNRHFRVNVGFDVRDLPKLSSETTTRGRSFIFFALAALVASSIEKRVPVYVPENGLISLNVPLDPLRLGAWSTRTTHPFYMARWQEMLNALSIDAELCNPYRFKTKGEMLAECKNSAFLQKNLAHTISCSSVSKARWKGRGPGHCGYCTPCLIRRASITAAFGSDPTKYTLSDLAAKPLQSKKKESSDIRSFKMMNRRLEKRPDLAKVLVYKTGPLDDYSSTEVSEYSSVFLRGIREVGVVVENAKFDAE